MTTAETIGSALDGEILQIRSDRPLDSREVLSLIADQQNPDLRAVMIEPPDRIEDLDDAAMGDAGWCKLSAFAGIS